MLQGFGILCVVTSLITVARLRSSSKPSMPMIHVMEQSQLSIYMIANQPLHPMIDKLWTSWANLHGYIFRAATDVCQEWSWKCKWETFRSLVRSDSMSGNASTWALVVDSDTVVLDLNRSLARFLAPDSKPVQLHWREQGEVIAGLILVKVGDPLADAFMDGWTAEDFTGNNGDNGALLVFLLRASSNRFYDASAGRCIKHRSGYYEEEFQPCFFNLLSKTPARQARLAEQGIKLLPPAAGFWRSLECKTNNLTFYPFKGDCVSGILSGDVFAHGCKRFWEHFRVAEDDRGLVSVEGKGLRHATIAEELSYLSAFCLFEAPGCYYGANAYNRCSGEMLNPACDASVPHMGARSSKGTCPTV